MTAPMSFSEYQAIEAVNWSRLKHMATSPLHYRHACDHDRGDTSAMFMGRAIHCAVLEPDAFPLRCVVYKGSGDRRTKAYKEFAEAHVGDEILMQHEYAKCLAIRDAVYANAHAKKLLTNGVAEVVRTWTDPATGLECKARLDYLTEHGAITDLKSTASIDRRKFERTCGELLYHGQGAHYRRGCDGTNPVTVIAVEQDAPYDVGVFDMTEDMLLTGDKLRAELMRRLVECKETDVWPGRYSGVQELNLPPWMEQDDDGGWDFS